MRFLVLIITCGFIYKHSYPEGHSLNPLLEGINSKRKDVNKNIIWKIQNLKQQSKHKNSFVTQRNKRITLVSHEKADRTLNSNKKHFNPVNLTIPYDTSNSICAHKINHPSCENRKKIIDIIETRSWMIPSDQNNRGDRMKDNLSQIRNSSVKHKIKRFILGDHLNQKLVHGKTKDVSINHENIFENPYTSQFYQNDRKNLSEGVDSENSLPRRKKDFLFKKKSNTEIIVKSQMNSSELIQKFFNDDLDSIFEKLAQNSNLIDQVTENTESVSRKGPQENSDLQRFKDNYASSKTQNSIEHNSEEPKKFPSISNAHIFFQQKYPHIPDRGKPRQDAHIMKENVDEFPLENNGNKLRNLNDLLNNNNKMFGNNVDEPINKYSNIYSTQAIYPSFPSLNKLKSFHSNTKDRNPSLDDQLSSYDEQQREMFEETNNINFGEDESYESRTSLDEEDIPTPNLQQDILKSKFIPGLQHSKELLKSTAVPTLEGAFMIPVKKNGRNGEIKVLTKSPLDASEEETDTLYPSVERNKLDYNLQNPPFLIPGENREGDEEEILMRYRHPHKTKNPKIYYPKNQLR